MWQDRAFWLFAQSQFRHDVAAAFSQARLSGTIRRMKQSCAGEYDPQAGHRAVTGVESSRRKFRQKSGSRAAVDLGSAKSLCLHA
jgi:hypothetical protein